MITMSDEQYQDVNTVTPLLDTWRVQKYAGAWCITLSGTGSASEGNAWYATTMRKTLEAFAHLARPRQVRFGTIVVEGVDKVTLPWKGDITLDTYIQNTMDAIQQYPAPIYSLEIQLDLFVYVRTSISPDKLVRVWISPPSEFVFWGTSETSGPYLCFEVAHTLFCPRSPDGDDNSELYALNQPLLEQALRSWEAQFGAISDVEGLPGIYEYGFSPSPKNTEESGV